MSRAGYWAPGSLGAAKSPRPGTTTLKAGLPGTMGPGASPRSATPRRLPALLRNSQPTPGGSEAGLAAPSSPRGGGASPRLTGRSVPFEARMARVNEANQFIASALAAGMGGAPSTADAYTNPEMFATIAQQVIPTASPRMIAALRSMRPKREGYDQPKQFKWTTTTPAAFFRGGDLQSDGAAAAASALSGDGRAASTPRSGMKAGGGKTATQQMLQDGLATKFKQVRDAFKYVDLDNNGKIERKEVCARLGSLSWHLCSRRVRRGTVAGSHGPFGVPASV